MPGRSVRDAAGNVPLNYQPDLLDPLGRTIMISFRKLFLPSPAAIRQMFQRDRQQQQPGRADALIPHLRNLCFSARQ